MSDRVTVPPPLAPRPYSLRDFLRLGAAGFGDIPEPLLLVLAAGAEFVVRYLQHP